MDMQKIGDFLTALRKEQNLTQEQLGEKLGVTNKTISRWETGTYLPPVEMLQMLAKLYNVSINDILCGERISEEKYKENAEKNLIESLDNSTFTIKEKKAFFEKKWKKDHSIEMIIEMLLLIAAIVLSVIFLKEIFFAAIILSFIWVIWINNRMATYVENHIFDKQNTNDKTENNK